MALFIPLVLRKDAAQIGLAGLGAAIGLFAFAPGQLDRPHAHPRAVAAGVEDRSSTGLRPGLAFLPAAGRHAHALHHALDLLGRDFDAAGFGEVFGGPLKARMVDGGQANQAGQRGGVAQFQPQGGIGRIVSLALAGGVIVITPEHKTAEHALGIEGRPALVMLTGFGLIAGVNAIVRLLQQEADQFGGGLEEGHPNQLLQLANPGTVGFLGSKTAHQLLDFRVLGEKDLRRGFFLPWRHDPPGS